MTTSTQWQLARGAAERYQNILTPTILGPFAKALVNCAALATGERVVDVGCGTGAAARYAAEIVGESGRVIGVDVNAGMIEVAESLTAVSGSPIEWRIANAKELPLDSQSVDAVLCAQSLQFMPEKQGPLSEMRRVVRPGGRAALSLWREIEESPYFLVLVETMAQHIGAETAAGLKSAFALSDGDEIAQLLKTAGFDQVEITTTQLDLPLPPLAEFVPLHISATPMAAGFSQASAATQQAVVDDIVSQLSSFTVNNDGRIPFKSYMVICSV